MPQDPLDVLMSLPSQRLQKIGDPRLSGLAEERLNAPAPERGSVFRLPYMTYDQIQEDAGDMYDPTDFKTVGERLRTNVAKAIEKRFPVVGEKYTLTVENVHYEKQKNTTKADERQILLDDSSLNDRLKGEWVLYDNVTGKEVQRKSATLLNVPRMTTRGTFIRNGSELGLKHMFRLRPGIYTRIKNNGVVAAHINPQQTTGRQMSLDMDPNTGVFSVGRGTRTYGLLPILTAAGMDEDTIKGMWGEELFNANKNKYGKLMLKGSKSEEEYRNLWNNDIAPILLDAETTESTLGEPFAKMDPRALLLATKRILQVSSTMDESDTDDRDSLQYQKVMGPADYIPERIVRDGGGLLRNLFNAVTRSGNLDPIVTGAFQPQVDSVFLSDKHAGYIDGSSPVESYDFASSISRIGEGGIGDTRAAPAETRGVNNSYLGFIDPVRSPESLKVGLDVYLSYGVKKDSNGNLYNKFINRAGKPEWTRMDKTAKSIVATPEFFNPKADPEEFIPAIVRGKTLDYVQRKDVDYYVADSNRMMSMGAGMIPLIGGIRSNRTLMGSKYANQGVPLEQGEAPLVQRALTLDDGTETTSEAHLGKQLGAQRSPVSGQIIKVDGDEIIVRDKDGIKHSIDLYREMPANQKGFLNNIPLVKVGDRVGEGQVIAKSNYTDDNGVAALGKNLKVAFLTARNGGTFEDGITISESAAKKLKSEQLYKVRGELTDDVEYNKNRFLSLFKQEYTNEQLDKIGDDGLPKPGAVFNEGDPVFLGVQLRDIGVNGLARNSAVPYVKTWEHEDPGTILDVVRGKKHLSIYAKAYTPMKIGDKMCFDDKTEVLTDRGWKLFKDLEGPERVLTLDVKSGDTYMTDYTKLYRYYHKGKMYSAKSSKIDILVTDNHQLPVSCLPTASYIRMMPASAVYGKALYFITGHDIFKPEAYAYMKDEDFTESWEHYEGFVYCITVPKTHIMYVRRNGKCCWSGNSNRYGAKGVVSQILPDDQMPQGADGTPFDVLQSPLGLPSRLNTSQLCETQLGKVAKATGTTYALPDFLPEDDDIISFTDRELKKAGLSASEDVYDPVSGKTIPGIETGNMFFYKLKHMSELKERGRATGLYSAEGVPMKGEGAARRFGSLEASAVYSGGGEEVLRDAKVIRGQRNDEFWRDFRTGKYPNTPSIPLVHKKFFAHLQAAGIHLEDRADRVHIYGATDSDIKRLSGSRKVTAAATFDSKNLQPIDGGLFDPKIFGAEGDQWGYVDLPEPVLNPVMFKTIGSVLGWKDKELEEYLTGARQVDGKFGPTALKEMLDKVDLNSEVKKAKDILRTSHTTLQQRDLARKRIRAIEPMLREGKKPSDFFWDRIPILPPRFRAVTAMANGTNIAADANFLYKRLMDSIGDLDEAKKALPEDMQLDARQSLYNAVGAVSGLTPTDDPKLEAKGVSGVLKWAFGKGSPKLGSLFRKVFGANLDLGGLGTITPDDSLTIDQVGIPERSAWKMFEPFVVRRLTQQGYSLVNATRAVIDKNDDATRALKAEMAKRPILVNRAPTLWRYGIQGMYPVMVKDNTIHVNPNICKGYNADFDGNCCDFDSEILLKISKSALDKLPSKMYLMIKAQEVLRSILGGEKMLNAESNVDTRLIKNGEFVYSSMKIGEFPHKDTYVVDKNGAKVYDAYEGFEVLTVDPVTGESSYQPITKFTVEDDCHTVKVKFSSAREVIMSDNESLAVFDPKSGTMAKVTPYDHAGRLIPIAPYRAALSTGVADVPRRIGWWIGALLSDGWVCDRYIGYAKEEKAKRDLFVEIARELHQNFNCEEYEGDVEDGKLGHSVKLHLYNSEFAEAVNKLGLYNEEARLSDENPGRSCLYKQIPQAMLDGGSDEFLWGLLSGLVDGDGSISVNSSVSKLRVYVKFQTSSKTLRDSVFSLLYRLGIRYSYTVCPPRGHSREAYVITLSCVDAYNNLDKFSCIGKAETAAIALWREQGAPKEQSDIVPITDEEWNTLKTAATNKAAPGLYSAITQHRYAIRSGYYKFIDFIKEHIPTLYKRLESKTTWCRVSEIEDAGDRQVFDFEVPATKLFAVNNGLVIYDSMTTHVPVSNEAVEAIKKNMMPSKNLLSPRDFTAHFIPRSEFAQGLYLASRVDDKQRPVRFRTEEEAVSAYKRGDIKVDTPVEIG